MVKQKKKPRFIFSHLVKLGEEELRMNKRENTSKKELYKKVINKCCMPGCDYGYNLEVHHIKPLGKSGKDDFDNFIVLCVRCHHRSRIHSRSEERKLELFVYKFYVEQDLCGYCSDDFSDDEYWKLLKNLVMVQNMKFLI